MSHTNSIGQGVQQGASAVQTRPDLRITIVRDWYTDYEGTADQLEAEGLVPAGLAWPRADAPASWDAGGFQFLLRRSRPPGHKGPKRSWLELDHWWMRVRLADVDFDEGVRRARSRRAAELRAEADRLTTPEGVRELKRLDVAFMAAEGDAAFRRFKGALLDPLARIR